jgi:diguanylate cyclase (GGDEF)-like protein
MHLRCSNPDCTATLDLHDRALSCPACADLLEVATGSVTVTPHDLKRMWLQRRSSYAPIDAPLTELPNRTLARDRIAEAVANARRLNTKVAVFLIDIDHFKSINDSLGHTTGDLLLQRMGERLRATLREQDTVARLGGDEFLAVLNAIQGSDEIAAMADRVLRTIAGGFVVHDRPQATTCSIGISIFPDDGDEAETLIKNADTAMYVAKDSGRNAWQIFGGHMHTTVVERWQLQNSLPQALETNPTVHALSTTG